MLAITRPLVPAGSLRRWIQISSQLCRKSKNHKKAATAKQKTALPSFINDRLDKWPLLIQQEIAENQQHNSVVNETSCGSDLRFHDYALNALTGSTVVLTIPDGSDIQQLKLGKSLPVRLIERGMDSPQRSYECVVLQQEENLLKLKLRGPDANLFDPQLAPSCTYNVLMSEHDSRKFLYDFLMEKDKWHKLPGYDVFLQAYRAKALPSVYADRKLRHYQRLNVSQQEAVNAAMNRRRPIVCIQGPPGTGKTHVLTEIILQANKANQKVLVCAPSHQALNNIFNRVQKHISNIVCDNRANSTSAAGSLNKEMESHTDFNQLSEMYEDICNVQKGMLDVSNLQQLSRSASGLHRKIKMSVIGSKNIVFTTLSSSSVSTLQKFGFRPDIVIIEEAGQATECASWVPLLQGTRAILAGDPCQLSCIVKNQEARSAGLNLSLLEYLHKEHGALVTVMLKEQYRMNEAIQRWSSDTFYESKLFPNSSVSSITLADVSSDLTGPAFGPMVFVDTSLAANTRTALERRRFESYDNPFEADIVMKQAEQLYKGGLDPRQVGIITPYSAQSLLLKKMNDSQMLTGSVVSTVDAFQGEQREAIIMSLVRHNPNGLLGFLCDMRRMNVSVTRAKRHFFLVGSSFMLKKHSDLRKLHRIFETYGQILSPSEFLESLNKDAERESTARALVAGRD